MGYTTLNAYRKKQQTLSGGVLADELLYHADHIAFVNSAGVIVAVNDAWRNFANQNGAVPHKVLEGSNYFQVCERAALSGESVALVIASMIRGVVNGLGSGTRREYPCHAHDRDWWFEVSMRRVIHQGDACVLVAHRNVTARHALHETARFYGHLLEVTDQAMIATDLDGTIRYWNQATELLYGWAGAEVTGKNISSVLNALYLRQSSVEIMTALHDGQSWTCEVDILNGWRVSMPVRITYSPINDDCGVLTGIVTISENMTARQESNHAFAIASLVYQAIGDSIIVVDPEHRVIAANPSYCSLSGYSESELLGKPAVSFLPDLRNPLLSHDIVRRLHQTGQWQGVVRMRASNGAVAPAWLRIHTAFDPLGTVTHRIGMFSALTEQKLAEAAVWQHVDYDSLTGLPNRRMFQDRLEHAVEVARRSGLQVGLMFIDLDHFKGINDSLGHHIGDLLLAEVASRLASCVRKADTIARIGGDEFTVVLSELADADTVSRIAASVLAALATPFMLDGHILCISGSIGATLYPDDAATVAALLECADQAMYVAKHLGRNQFCFFTVRMQDEYAMRTRIARDLHAAVNEWQFEIFYQPIVTLSARRVVKAEALLRWNHPIYGAIEPAKFIPIAEQCGVLVEICNQLYRRVQQQIRSWRQQFGRCFQITVNLSESSVLRGNADFASGHWDGLVAEVSGKLLLDRSCEINAALHGIRENGAEIAIDDFGVCTTSIESLSKSSVRYLKIARSLVAELESQADRYALFEAILAMAQKLGMQVIAQGVETPDQHRLLLMAGCELGQGFLLGMPMSAIALEELLKAQNRSTN